MDLLKSNMAVGLTAAVAATVLAPVLVPLLTAAGRPLAKSLIKGGVLLYEKGREAVAESGEIIEDLIAEVHAEMRMQPGSSPAATAPSAPRHAAEAEEERAAPRRPNGQGESGTALQ